MKRHKFMKHFAILILSFLLYFSCSAPQQEQTSEPDAVPEAESTTLTVTKADPAATFETAEILEMTYTDSMFSFKIADGDYQLGMQTPDAPERGCANSAKGQHIHLIIDQEPYSAQYTADFPYGISDGDHYLLAFLSRSYHESIKTPEAHLGWKALVENNSIAAGAAEEIAEPAIFYSRPKGTYTGTANTNKVLLDFYVLNAEIGEGKYTVNADINGQSFSLDAWQPYFIEGLPMGQSTITLTLMDPAGNAVAHPLNPVSRTITLEPDPAEQAVEQ